MASERSPPYISVEASLGVCTLSVAEKLIFESRRKGGVFMRGAWYTVAPELPPGLTLKSTLPHLDLNPSTRSVHKVESNLDAQHLYRRHCRRSRPRNFSRSTQVLLEATKLSHRIPPSLAEQRLNMAQFFRIFSTIFSRSMQISYLTTYPPRRWKREST